MKWQSYRNDVPRQQSSDHTTGTRTEPSGGKDLLHYCRLGDCWCSEKLSGISRSAGCVRLKCEYLNASQDTERC